MIQRYTVESLGNLALREKLYRKVMALRRNSAEKLVANGVLVVGRWTYDVPKIIIHPGDNTKVRIGSFCSIAEDVAFLPGGNHRIDTVTSYPIRIRFGLPGAYLDGQPWSKGDIIVGNDVWIGRSARVLSGVRIGDGAVVAASSVVTRNVEPYEIVAGVSARHVRYRFEADTITSLRAIAWWNWNDDLIRERVEDLTSPDISAFVAKYGEIV